MKLGLGTAQFGLDYGISNRQGQSSLDEVKQILALAAQQGVRVLDTAALYGCSEEVLGEALPLGHAFSIVTKTPVFSKKQITSDDAQQLQQVFYRSLEKLKAPGIYALLIHHVDDLLSENGHMLMSAMQALQKKGLVDKIGVSVYTGEQIDRVLDQFPIDIVQLPINVLDQRLLSGGYLQRLKSRGVEVHARSIFLQGLLLMDPADLPPFFDAVRAHMLKFHEVVKQHGGSTIRAAISFVNGLRDVDVMLCGVDTCQHLQEILESTLFPLEDMDYSAFALADPAILNPSLWKL